MKDLRWRLKRETVRESSGRARSKDRASQISQVTALFATSALGKSSSWILAGRWERTLGGCGLFHVRPSCDQGACFVIALEVANHPYGKLVVALGPHNHLRPDRGVVG
jgi:hypothetical protein